MFKTLLVAGSLCALFLSGCAKAPVAGVIYTDVQDAVNATYSQRPTKLGTACANSYLGLIAMGDASINTARENGHINSVSSVDYSTWSILGLYTKYCVNVRGN